MQLSKALTKIHKSPDLPGLFVVVLSGYDYPQVFLTQFYQRLARRTSEVIFLDTATLSLDDGKAQFEMSFLGMRRLYILKNLSLLDAASKKKWLSYLKDYRGPHGLIFFESLGKTKWGKVPAKKSTGSESRSDTDTQLIIELPITVDTALYNELFTFLYPAIQPDPSFQQRLYTYQRNFGLDDACRMMAYQTIVGRQCGTFFQSWCTKLMASETSLFTLSQHLFSRNSKQFFSLWKNCKADFPPEFWIAYWSEQIWQAAQYVVQKQSSGPVQTKGYRLPFSFLNTDYRRYSPATLSRAHDELYLLDYSLKNGASDYGLDLWYHRFLSGR